MTQTWFKIRFVSYWISPQLMLRMYRGVCAVFVSSLLIIRLHVTFHNIPEWPCASVSGSHFLKIAWRFICVSLRVHVHESQRQGLYKKQSLSLSKLYDTHTLTQRFIHSTYTQLSGPSFTSELGSESIGSAQLSFRYPKRSETSTKEAGMAEGVRSACGWERERNT